MKFHVREAPTGEYHICTENGTIAKTSSETMAVYLATLHNRAEESDSEDRKQAYLMSMSPEAARVDGVLR